MVRIVQPIGTRGSLKWIQRAVNDRPDLLDKTILPALGGAQAITWLSPVQEDVFAEYRDRDFLVRIGHSDLSGLLRAFWPEKGPQWDALGKSDDGDVLLVEAKTHLDELFPRAVVPNGEARALIDAALTTTMVACGARPKVAWTETFFGLASRLAHLHFLRQSGVRAWLVLVNFVGDREMGGPQTSAEWEAAYHVAYHMMSINPRSPLMRCVLNVHPDVAALEQA